nr:Golgi SNAP receptor complex [Hymenolepis microstoma]
MNQELTSNYHDPTVCHIRPLPQYSPYPFLYICVCPFYICESFYCSSLSTLCGIDVHPLCEACGTRHCMSAQRT